MWSARRKIVRVLSKCTQQHDDDVIEVLQPTTTNLLYNYNQEWNTKCHMLWLCCISVWITRHAVEFIWCHILFRRPNTFLLILYMAWYYHNLRRSSCKGHFPPNFRPYLKLVTDFNKSSQDKISRKFVLREPRFSLRMVGWMDRSYEACSRDAQFC